jgi:hypothetical protein
MPCRYLCSRRYFEPSSTAGVRHQSIQELLAASNAGRALGALRTVFMLAKIPTSRLLDSDPANVLKPLSVLRAKRCPARRQMIHLPGS